MYNNNVKSMCKMSINFITNKHNSLLLYVCRFYVNSFYTKLYEFAIIFQKTKSVPGPCPRLQQGCKYC